MLCGVCDVVHMSQFEEIVIDLRIKFSAGVTMFAGPKTWCDDHSQRQPITLVGELSYEVTLSGHHFTTLPL